MRKLLITILTVVLLILCGYTIAYGINIGNFKILGVMKIKEKNEQLDEQINNASKLASVDYQKTLVELTNSYKDLQKEKENYESLVTISSDEQIQAASQYEKYEIEFLWTKIGNYATSEGVKLKMEIKNSSSGTDGLYDLYFTTNGTYVGITDFITDIENDSKLGFKIDNFKLIPSDSASSELQGTFTCKDININLESAQVTSSSTDSTTQNNTNSNNQNSNTTNTNQNSTNNTTNTTNTNTVNNQTTNTAKQ